MEAVVHQALGQIINLQTSAALERAQIKDALVGDTAIGAAVEHREMGFESLSQVIGSQQSHRRGLAQTGATHQADVHPADRQDAGAAPRGC